MTGKKEKDYNPQEEYPGTAPFSEPEAQLIKGITESFRPHVWLNVHRSETEMWLNIA